MHRPATRSAPTASTTSRSACAVASHHPSATCSLSLGVGRLSSSGARASATARPSRSHAIALLAVVLQSTASMRSPMRCSLLLFAGRAGHGRTATLIASSAPTLPSASSTSGNPKRWVTIAAVSISAALISRSAVS